MNAKDKLNQIIDTINTALQEVDNRNSNQYKTQILKEELAPANISELQNQMSADPKLAELLRLRAVYLPEKYRYLVDEVYEESDDVCLYDMIFQSQQKLGKDKVFFSKCADKIVGWAGYDTDITKRRVTEIKMFSFDLNRPNPVLIRDLDKLLQLLINKYEEVSWCAFRANPANDIYIRAIQKYGGTSTNINDSLVMYTIQGTIGGQKYGAENNK